MPEEALLKLGVVPDQLDQFKNLKKGEGCDNCSGTGLKGRVAVFEFFRMTASIKEIINKSPSPLEIKRAAIAGGMITLRQNALFKMRMGLTTAEEVVGNTVADDV